MTKEVSLFTSESVTEGHPDKVCDQISDAILDAMLKDDPNSRSAVETLVTTGMVIVAGEVTTKTYVDIPKVVRATLHEIGYNLAELGFEYESCGVMTAIQAQSPDIALGVNHGGAGDQGMMFGYACNETPELMPMPILLAHRITQQLSLLRKTGKVPYLYPDGKSQVTVQYEGYTPTRLDTIIISAHHNHITNEKKLRQDLMKHIIKNPAIIPQKYLDKKTKILVNPTGRFEIGGPEADTGLTGRKIVVDSYGGMGHCGGGAFSGKDPTKVDRSASYMARYIAKNIVASKLADRCEIQLAYAIGVVEPVSVKVHCFGTGKVADEVLEYAVRKTFSLTPRGMIKALNLLRPIYKKTAAYGHFGRSEKEFTWERTDRVQILKRHVNQRLRTNGTKASVPC